MFWWIKRYPKVIEDSKYSATAEKTIKMTSVKKGQRLYSNEYDQLYIYLTGGRVVLEFIKKKPLF